MRDRRLLIPPSLGVACSGQKVPKAVLWSSTPMSCCSLLRHLPPALERLSKRKGIVIVALTNCYLTVSYITLSFLWPFPFPFLADSQLMMITPWILDFAFQLSAIPPRSWPGGLLSIYTGPIHRILAPCMEMGTLEGSLSLCHPVGFNLRSIRRINR